MKKTMPILLALLILQLLFILPAAALPADLSEVVATVDDSRLVTVSGYISSGAGQTVNIRITDPDGNIEYIGSTVSDNSGLFRYSYIMEEGTAFGRYDVTVNASGISIPAVTYFEYGANHKLEALIVSRGSLSPVFSPETIEYSVRVGTFTDSITLTPVAADSKASIKINGTEVASGSKSAPFTLADGSNKIEMVVTAQNGDTGTYTITVVREALFDTTLTAEASIDSKKIVTISGSISSGTGQHVAIRIIAPDGSIEYIGTAISESDNSYRLSYNMLNGTAGRYTVNVSTLGVATPVEAYFDYGSDATLKSLVISEGTLSPVFKPETMVYTVWTESDTLMFIPTAEDEKARIEINESVVTSGSTYTQIGIGSGINTIIIKVTSQDGKNKKEYVVSVIKKEFSVLNVTAEIDNSRQVFISGSGAAVGMKVAVMVTDPNGMIDYINSIDSSDTGLFQFSYTLENEASGTYQVAVGAQYANEKAYTEFVVKSNNADIKDLSVSEGFLWPIFESNVTIYSATVADSVSEIYVTPTAYNAGAVIKVNGQTVSSGTMSQAIPLVMGENIISIDVTAETMKNKTYTIFVFRSWPLSDNANLSSLITSAGRPNETFMANVTAYTMNVANAVNSLTVTPTAADSTAVVKVNGMVVANGSPSGSISLATGNNTITIVVTAEDGTTVKTYTITVTRAKSSNANLSSLITSAGSLNETFTANVTAYTMNVANAVNSLTVAPTAADSTAVVKINGTVVSSGTPSGAISLATGDNTITIAVTAEDGTTVKTYTIIVTRAKSSNANLSSLITSEGRPNETFTANLTAYTIDVANTVNSLTVTSTVADSTAVVKINGMVVSSGTPSGAISLATGDNTITIVVTAEDGTTVKTYTLTVNRAKSSNANLRNLAVSAGSLDTPFLPDITWYTVNVAVNVSQVTVTPTTWDENATVTVNGKTVRSGSTSEAINIGAGLNYVYIKVTAENGTEKTYGLNVVRALSSNANLSSITVSVGTLSPAFEPSTTNYTVSVGNDVNSITLGIVTDDKEATFTVNGHHGYDNSTPFTANNLDVGSNVILIDVKAQNDVTIKKYTVNVTRESPPPSANANLSGITLTSGSITGFDPAVTSYTVSVSGVTSINVKPNVEDYSSTVTVNGSKVEHGLFSGPIALSVGDNKISIVITAANGNTRTYIITVKRTYNVDLTAMYLYTGINSPAISLNPSFSHSTSSYTAIVDYRETSVTVTPWAAESTSVITVNNAMVQSGTASGAISLNSGANTIVVMVTAPDGTSKTYTVAVTRSLQNTADLSGLTLSAGNLEFSPSTTNYEVVVTNLTESITVTPTPVNPNATVTVNGGPASNPVSLNFGKYNLITIIVTAQNGTTTKTYTIQVDRPFSTDGTLSDLAVSSGSLNPSFSPSVKNYTVNVENSVSSITVRPTANNPNYHSLTVGGVDVESGSPVTIDLPSVGSKTITIRVEPQIGDYNYYYLTVIRAGSGNANLSGLTLSSGSLNKDFSSDVTEYSANVPNETSSLTVMYTLADSTATAVVSGGTLLNVGSNTVKVTVTAQNGTVKVYTITVNRAPSGNANLSGLTLSSGSLNKDFSADVTEYAANVPYETGSVTVMYTLADSTATAVVDGGALLNVGSNTVKVTVTAQNGTVKVYTITINRLSNNSVLSSLSLTGGTLSPAFDKDVTGYTMNVANGTGSITVTPVAADSNALVTVKCNGTAITGSNVYTVNLEVGGNTIEVEVTAQDGSKKTYVIIVTRLSNIAVLNSMSLSGGTLNPSFSKDVTEYTMTVANETSSVTVMYTLADGTASAVVSGASQLNVGSNTVKVTVTAQDGTVKVYTITVTRLSNNADLGSLSLTGGTLNPAFSKDVTGYNMTVANETSSITVRPVAEDSKATIEVIWNGANIGSAGEYTSTLNVGINEINITVTAENGNRKTYKVTVNRSGSNNAKLKSMSVWRWLLTPPFDNNVTDYTVEVYSDTESIQITAIADDVNAEVKINGGSESTVNLNPAAASEKITVTVTAEDGETTKNYIITVNRSSEAEPIYNIWIDGNLLNGTITANKETAVANETINLTIIPAEGYRLKAGTLRYMVSTEIGSQEYPITGNSFTMPTANVVIRAEFEMIP